VKVVIVIQYERINQGGYTHMKIELWSDFACPFCYIGKKRFEQALNAFEKKDEVEVSYKAYQLNPNAPKTMEGTAAESFAKGHDMDVKQAEERFRMFTENAKTVDLTYRYDIMQMTNTFDAHRLAKWADTKGLEPEITDRFMQAYFSEGKNLSDYETLAALAAEVGLDRNEALDVLKKQAYADVVQSQITEGHQVGVQGVPFFVINRKYGVSGAQQKEYFLAALKQIHDEEKELNVLNEKQDDDASCEGDACGI
jgi:predicted DsbA family dithiol-disulfide isomerase